MTSVTSRRLAAAIAVPTLALSVLTALAFPAFAQVAVPPVSAPVATPTLPTGSAVSGSDATQSVTGAVNGSVSGTLDTATPTRKARNTAVHTARDTARATDSKVGPTVRDAARANSQGANAVAPLPQQPVTPLPEQPVISGRSVENWPVISIAKRIEAKSAREAPAKHAAMPTSAAMLRSRLKSSACSTCPISTPSAPPMVKSGASVPPDVPLPSATDHEINFNAQKTASAVPTNLPLRMLSILS